VSFEGRILITFPCDDHTDAPVHSKCLGPTELEKYLYQRGRNWQNNVENYIMSSLIGHIACMRENKHACEALLQKSERKKPLGICEYRLDDNIRMDLKEKGGRGLNSPSLGG
jgi:hypothetical protein